MRESFQRAVVHLDIETQRNEPIIQQKEKIQTVIDNATPEQLGQVLEVLNNIGKTHQVSA